MRDIKVDGQNVNMYSESISETVKGFQHDQLSCTDFRSTITANAKGREAYSVAQSAEYLLGECLTQEANNIRSLGITFQQYDEMLANIAEIESVRQSEIPE